MTTLNTDLNTDHAKPVSAEASQATQAPVEQSAAPAALITEQQVMFGSAAALAPAPAKTHFWSRAAHAVFTRSEKTPRPKKHYPQRFSYLEGAAMSREMDRL